MSTATVKTLGTPFTRRLLRRVVWRLGLDRRKVYAEWQGILCTDAKVTVECSGCTEYGDYGTRYGPYGCHECGYTGKRVARYPEPVMVNGVYVKMTPNAGIGRGGTPLALSDSLPFAKGHA